MSYSWSAASSPSFVSIKPATTNSFADALKRLAEHVEEKNKSNTNNGSTIGSVQPPTDLSNRINPSLINNAIPPEQALRLYTQYIQEIERRDDIRRCYLRTYGGSDNSNGNLPPLNRRVDMVEPYRFMAPHLSGLIHPSTYFQSLQQQTRGLSPSSHLFSNIKTVDTTPRISTQENVDKKSESLSNISKPKTKLFRPYDLDSPASNSHPRSPPSSPNLIKKSTSSSPTFLSSTSVIPDESPSTATSSSGKEKQLFNSLGLVQQFPDNALDKSSVIESSPSIAINEDSTSIDTNSIQQDNHLDKAQLDIKNSSSIKLKRKLNNSSKKSSNRKQTKIDTVDNNTVE